MQPIYLSSSRLNLTITGWGKMNYEGFDGNDFHRQQQDEDGLGRVLKLQEGVVPIISRTQCGDAKVRMRGVIVIHYESYNYADSGLVEASVSLMKHH